MFLVLNYYTYIFCRSIEAQANCGRCEKHSSLDLRQTWTLHAHSSPKMPYRASQSAAQELNAFHPSVPSNHVISHGLLAMLEVFSIAILHRSTQQIQNKTHEKSWRSWFLIHLKFKFCLKWLLWLAISHVYHCLKKKLWSWGHVYFVISSNSTGQPKCCPLQIKTIEKANLGHVFHTKQVRLHPKLFWEVSPSCQASISR